jgi:hypothetical protein
LPLVLKMSMSQVFVILLFFHYVCMDVFNVWGKWVCAILFVFFSFICLLYFISGIKWG